MCMLCVEIAKGSMTYREIARAYVEYTDMESDHIGIVMVEIMKKYGQEGFGEIGREIGEEYDRIAERDYK